MFAEVMLRDRASVTAADLAAQFNDVISMAAVRMARMRFAEEWMSGDFRRDMIQSLIAAAKPIAFACGLELLPPEQLDLSSPSLSQQRQTESCACKPRALSAGRLAHLKHAGEMMAKFQEMRQAAPNLPAGALLDRIRRVIAVRCCRCCWPDQPSRRRRKRCGLWQDRICCGLSWEHAAAGGEHRVADNAGAAAECAGC